MTKQFDQLEKITRNLIETIGEDPSREGLLKTPKRVAKSWEYFSEGYRTDLDNIINEAFSSKVINVGTTTTTDVEWWMRQKVTDLGLETWFHPSVDIQRFTEENQDHLRSFSNRPDRKIIQKGDLLHCDFGITYLRLNSDCQQMAYVMKDDEKESRRQ